MDPVKVGIIGCGCISPAHARGYAAAGARIVAVADVREGVRAKRAKESGVPEQYESADRLLTLCVECHCRCHWARPMIPKADIVAMLERVLKGE